MLLAWASAFSATQVWRTGTESASGLGCVKTYNAEHGAQFCSALALLNCPPEKVSANIEWQRTLGTCSVEMENFTIDTTRQLQQPNNAAVSRL
jgi:hypothetical protein